MSPQDTVYPRILPGAEPFLLPGGPIGCLLVHGFGSFPEEMEYLGAFLQGRGYTVLAQRLAGHATDPRDLEHTHWTDWLASMEDGLALLRRSTQMVFIIGQSMGGMLALITAAHHHIAGVVALSTPYHTFTGRELFLMHLMGWLPLGGWRGKDRRQEHYPAYAWQPVKIGLEATKLQQELHQALPLIRVPVLLMHSKTDDMAPFDSMQQIHDALQTEDRQMVALEDMDHSLVRDPNRKLVFDAVDQFIQKVPSA